MSRLPDHDQSLLLLTTVGGLLGGLSRAFNHQLQQPLLPGAISWSGIVDVAFYALISGSVGYGVKFGWDLLAERIRQGR
jgi:hypothetical protein